MNHDEFETNKGDSTDESNNNGNKDRKLSILERWAMEDMTKLIITPPRKNKKKDEEDSDEKQ